MENKFKSFIKDLINTTHLWNNVDVKPIFDENNIQYSGCITIVFIEEDNKYSELFLKHIPQDISVDIFNIKPGDNYEDYRSLTKQTLTKREFKKTITKCQENRKIVIISLQEIVKIPIQINFDIIINLLPVETHKHVSFGKLFKLNSNDFTCKNRKKHILPYIHIETDNTLLKVYIIRRFFVTCVLNKVGSESYMKTVCSIKTNNLGLNKRRCDDDDDGILYTVIKKIKTLVSF